VSPEDFDYLRDLVHTGCALALDGGKAYLAEARLAPLARREGLGSVAGLLDRLRGGAGPGLRQQVIEAMVTNETSFFRDVHPFESLRQTVLPELLRRRAPGERLTIWCAACSTGQEPYSLAMLLCEHFPDLVAGRVRILASDLSTAVLEKARQGVYSQFEVNRGLPARLLVKYFRRAGLDWRLADEVRSLVEFFPLNLVEAWPMLPSVDVALVRNVLIYFDVPARKLVLGKFRRQLRPDGYLFLGGAETTFGLDDGFEREQMDRAGCYRLVSRVADSGRGR
jgi:chemotaxis protein methyltransferase CheR